MEPNNNMQNDNMSEPKPVRAPGFANSGSASGGDASGGATPANGGNDVVFQDKPKKNHSMLYGMILLAILAAGGIGFGVWAMMDGNSRAQKKDEQISQLQSQLAEKSEVVVEEDTTVVDTEDSENYRNPVIKSNDPEIVYRVGFESSYYFDDNNQNYVMRINLKDGGIDTCLIYRVNGALDSECVITGLNGEIFRVVEFGEGQDNSDSNIGFIMADGTVQYFPFIEAMRKKDFSIKGQLSVNGFVSDVFGITVGSSNPNVAGGYGSTVFILKDGSFLKYDKSMLQ